MNKLTLKLFIVVIVFSMPGLCLSGETIEYHNEYKGLIVNSSTLNDVISILGHPARRSQVNKTVIYSFNGVDISVYSDTGLINSIIIHDKSYIDDNGIRVGDEFDSVKYLQEIIIVDSTIFDQKHGIVYWFRKNHVTKIVLVGKVNKITKNEKVR